MSESLSQEFVISFLTTCFNHGMSKEAAAKLLQQASIEQTLKSHPDFAAGFTKAASEQPGAFQLALRPGIDVHPEDLEKEAFLKALLQAGGHFGRGIGSIGNAGIKAVKDIGVGMRGAKNVARRFPVSSSVAAAGLTGAGVYGANKMLTRDDLLPYADDPYMTPSGYSPEHAEKVYKSELENHTPGIFSSNEELINTRNRRMELEKAIRDRKAGGGAYRELQTLKRREDELDSSRGNYHKGMRNAQGFNADLINRIESRQQDLENQRTSPWYAPKRWWHQWRGGNLFNPGISQNYYDKQIAKLQDTVATSDLRNRSIDQRTRLLEGMATKPNETHTPTAAEMQQRFFPTY